MKFTHTTKIQVHATQIILLLLVLSITPFASAAGIWGIDMKPDKLDIDDDFEVTAILWGDTRGMVVKFYVGDFEFSSINVGADKDEIDSNKWKHDDKKLKCGPHTVHVELIDGETIVDEIYETISIGNVPTLRITPENPLPSKEVTLDFVDNETGKPLNNLYMDIYRIKDGLTSKKHYSANAQGKVILTPKEIGEYKIIVDDSTYCGSWAFPVKKDLIIDGPHPQDPLAGELITLAISGAVGAKVLDESGELYTVATTSIGGGVNFTIADAGEYTLILGGLSTRYWGRNITISVSGRLSPSIKIIEKPIVGRGVTISVTSGGEKLKDAAVKINTPVGGSETYITDSEGDVTFIPSTLGRYTVTVEKDKYEVSDAYFTAQNSMDMIIMPEKPYPGEDIAVIVKNQLGSLIEDASVFIKGTSLGGLTNSNGKFKFSLDKPAEYTIFITRENYWNATGNLRVYGLLSVKAPREVEVGTKVEIQVFDNEGNLIDTQLEIKKPDGTKEFLEYIKSQGESPGESTEDMYTYHYVPTESGMYTVTASKEDYKSANTSIIATPHTLHIARELEGGKLAILVSSNLNPVPGITVSLETPAGSEDRVTDENGSVLFDIKEGNIRISVNSENVNKNYEARVVNDQVKKQYNYLMLILAVTIVIVLSMVAALIVAKLAIEGPDADEESDAETGGKRKERHKGQKGEFEGGGAGGEELLERKGGSALSEV